MNRDKQIEEMDSDIRCIVKSHFVQVPKYSRYGGYEGTVEILTREIARDLYNAGYRKQSEGEWISAYDYALKLGETDEKWLAEAKKDKWWHFCSLCEQPIKFTNNYCPNCGAKMKGGEQG